MLPEMLFLNKGDISRGVWELYYLLKNGDFEKNYMYCEWNSPSPQDTNAEVGLRQDLQQTANGQVPLFNPYFKSSLHMLPGQVSPIPPSPREMTEEGEVIFILKLTNSWKVSNTNPPSHFCPGNAFLHIAFITRHMFGEQVQHALLSLGILADKFKHKVFKHRIPSQIQKRFHVYLHFTATSALPIMPLYYVYIWDNIYMHGYR